MGLVIETCEQIFGLKIFSQQEIFLENQTKKLMIEKNLASKSYCCSNRNMFLIEKLKSLTVSIAHIYRRIERKV